MPSASVKRRSYRPCHSERRSAHRIGKLCDCRRKEGRCPVSPEGEAVTSLLKFSRPPTRREGRIVLLFLSFAHFDAFGECRETLLQALAFGAAQCAPDREALRLAGGKKGDRV